MYRKIISGVLIPFVITASVGVSAEQKWKPSSSNFESDELPIATTIRCESDETVGFNWRDGSWTKVNFRESTYIFKKLDHRLEDRSVGTCRFSIAGETDLVEKGKFMGLNRCYSVQEFGEGKPTVKVCKEYYVDGEIDSIRCGSYNEYAFHPYGQLLLSPHHRNVKSNPKDDYKDSFSIGVGKCAQM